MGKKNRRKKANKKERKEQLEERRERRHEIVDDDSEYDDDSEDDDEPEDLSVQVGSRVFYATDSSREMRGIVKDIPSEGRYVVLPVDKADKSDSYVHLPERQVIRDDKEWTMRFKVGDNIVFRHSSDSPWLRGSITGHFPCHFDDDFVSCYTCIKDGIMETEYSIPLDTDEWLMAHPQSFRFSVGDDVVFASSLAVGVRTSMMNEAWIRGKITNADILGRSDFYAAYECSYIDRKRSRKCRVLKDDDQHITSPTSTPRERLFEAIEQDCSYEHIDNLIESSGLDVMAFRDLFLSKAIENASYSALLWLQESAGEDLVRIHDPLGNTILHQIAKSPHAERFFAAAAANEWKDEDSEYEPTIDLIRKQDFLARNNHGRTFLHELIVSGNKRSFDILLSPSMGLAWKTALNYTGPVSSVEEMMRDNNGLSLKDTARLLGRFEMEKMIDEFNEWILLYKGSCWLDGGRINLNGDVFCTNYDKINPLKGMVEWESMFRGIGPGSLLAVLTVERRTDLIKWLCQDQKGNDFDKSKKIAVVRIAAHLGHTDIVDLFLGDPDNDLDRAAVLGAMEAGNVDDMTIYFCRLTSATLSPDPISNEFESIPMEYDESSLDRRKTILASSFTGTALFAFLVGTTSKASSFVTTNIIYGELLSAIEWMLSEALTTVPHILKAASLVLRDVYDICSYERCTDLLDFLGTDYRSDVIQCSNELQCINEFFSSNALMQLRHKDRNGDVEAAVTKRWLRTLVRLGFDIQSLEFKFMSYSEKDTRLNHARTSYLLECQEVRYNKIYVDEVQDYTQAEIALFFYLCGPGDLFLAGDPAQSVVEGVEFRFEEIRSVGYHLYGDDRRHLIPEKPLTVHINFRSHCGILNVAAAVLSCLFEAFPDSAKQLKEDRGLFQGPRPGVFHKVKVPRLTELASKRNGIVVLTHDRNVTKWSRSLGDHPSVYGIREAKGLEFQEIILVDFFHDIPASLQKFWRDLLLGRDASDIACRPEIEGHLKLLYTAATRCIQSLYFAETTSSLAGNAFVRWLTTTTTARSAESEKGKEALAVRSSVESVEKMTRTPDEWRSAGLDNAAMAESADELSEKLTWIDRALYCFEQVEDNELARRARAHRLCIHFQLAFDESDTNDKDIVETELQAALLTEQLLRERLLSEAREVCCAILPMLGERAQAMLQDRLISQIPSGDTD